MLKKEKNHFIEYKSVEMPALVSYKSYTDENSTKKVWRRGR